MKHVSKKIFFSLMLCLILIPSICFSANNSAILDGLQFIKKPLGLSDFNIIVFISKIINVALGLMGIVMVLMVILIGFRYMVAMGDEEASANLRKSFLNLIVGVIIIFSSYSIAHFVISSILSAT